MAEIGFDWRGQDHLMLEKHQKLCGILLAVITLGFGFIPIAGPYFLRSFIFFMLPLSYRWFESGLWFLSTFMVGIVGEKAVGLTTLSEVWVWPEILIAAILWLIVFFLKESHEEIAREFGLKFSTRKEEFSAFQKTSEKLKKENSQIEKQLRNIEHLYDVIKEAGTTLSVQEMLEVAKEFTERMFNLPHFIIGVLSSEGRRFEIKVASGCDEAFFHSFDLELESIGLGSVFAREKKAHWIPDIQSEDRFSKLKHLPIRSLAFFPFLVQDRVIGFLCTFSENKMALDEETLYNFEVFCNQISIGLQKSLLYEKVQKLSITDGLTKLYSHRYFKQRLEEELILANRYSSQLSLLILDIDHFKHYNDTYGHVAGDHVLMEVAKILKGQSDVTHLVARYGGEEMVLIASETTKEQAFDLAEKIRMAIESYTFSVGKESTGVTVSVGVATFPQDAQTNLDLIGKADKALYAAKSRGRNQVVTYPF
jgi:diguanylate cyclase (GGDEF)-like protein